MKKFCRLTWKNIFNLKFQFEKSRKNNYFLFQKKITKKEKQKINCVETQYKTHFFPIYKKVDKMQTICRFNNQRA